jgi:hypothetical protein
MFLGLIRLGISFRYKHNRVHLVHPFDRALAKYYSFLTIKYAIHPHPNVCSASEQTPARARKL